MNEKFWREESELSDVEEDEAAEFKNGIARGLEWAPSPGPSGLGEGDVRGCGITEGDGGRRSVIPNRCSDVRDGIYIFETSKFVV